MGKLYFNNKNNILPVNAGWHNIQISLLQNQKK